MSNVFQAISSMMKTSGDQSSPEAEVPLAHIDRDIPLSGCIPAEPDYDKKRITITSSKTFFKNVLKNDISRCAKKAQISF